MKKWKQQVSILVTITTIIVGVQIVNMLTHGRLNYSFGLLPRSISGLWGIILAPWLHGDWAHVASNLPPLLLFSALIMWESTSEYIKLSTFIIFIGGLLVWIFGREAYHIGASSWIFGLWAWLIVRSYYQHNLKNFLISIFIIFIYGGVAWGLLPQTGISVEGHIAGALSGVLAASFLRPKQVRIK